MTHKLGTIAIALVAAALLPSAASAQALRASTASPTWTTATPQEQLRVSYVTGPATPPAGTGSVQLSAGTGPDGLVKRVSLRTNAFGELQLYNIGQLTYWTYSSLPGGESVPTLSLTLDNNNDGLFDDTLVYVPPSAVANTWQKWDARHGLWFSTKNGGQARLITFDTYVSEHPLSRLANRTEDFGGVGLTVGDSVNTATQVGNVDRVELVRNGVLGPLSFDFENDLPGMLG